jgi:hypothetical protein
MAAELARKIGRNSVEYETATKKGHIDLAGDPHFDKKRKKDIPTPHVQESTKNYGPNGKLNLSNETIRPATKSDIRTAKSLWERLFGD